MGIIRLWLYDEPVTPLWRFWVELFVMVVVLSVVVSVLTAIFFNWLIR